MECGRKEYAAASAPGPVRNFNTFPSSCIGIVLKWDQHAIGDEETCDYEGDCGAAIITLC